MTQYPIVILHGWNLFADRYAGLGAVLRSHGHIVWCEDLPGFGQAMVPRAPLVLDDYVSHVRDVIRRRSLQSPVLIGHSFGGRIGIKLAAQSPELLRGMVLSGVPGFPPVPALTVRLYRLLATVGRKATDLPGLAALQDRLRPAFYRLVRSSDYAKTSPQMRETFKRIVAESLAAYMPQITVPTLLLWGEDDRIVPVSIARKMKQVISSSKLVTIAGARHGVPWTRADEFAHQVETFLQSLP